MFTIKLNGEGLIAARVMANMCRVNAVRRCVFQFSVLGSSGGDKTSHNIQKSSLQPDIGSSNRKLKDSTPASSSSPYSSVLHELSGLSLRSNPLISPSGFRNATIGDVVLYDKMYYLPVYNHLIKLDHTEPAGKGGDVRVLDPPAVTQPLVDPSTVIRKEAKKMSVLRIRHKKMKKHKRRKFMKRMRFVLRKKRALKAKRKEKALQEFEAAQAKWAREFDAEGVVDAHLEKAREAGWGIDILAERSARKMSAKN